LYIVFKEFLKKDTNGLHRWLVCKIFLINFINMKKQFLKTYFFTLSHLKGGRLGLHIPVGIMKLQKFLKKPAPIFPDEGWY